MMNVILKKLKMLGTASKFNWAESFSDPNGKSSITAVAAAYLTFLGGIDSTYAVFTKQTDALVQIVFIIGFGASLFGVRKVMNGKPVMEETSTEIPDPPSKTTIESTTITSK